VNVLIDNKKNFNYVRNSSNTKWYTSFIRPYGGRFRYKRCGDGVTTQKRIAYQLKTMPGDEITPIEVITSPKPDTIYVDFHKDIIPYIFTAVPEIGGGWTARNAQEMLIGIELFIGEYVTDLEECTTEGELKSAGAWEVLNTAFQPYESPDLSAYTTLTHQPRSTWQWREAANYLCFWQNIGGGTISTALDSVSASTHLM